jgi:hypothetical protein
MSPSSGSYESDDAAERRTQRVLNGKVGDRLVVQRSWSQRLKWHARTFGSRKRARAEA